MGMENLAQAYLVSISDLIWIAEIMCCCWLWRKKLIKHLRHFISNVVE